MSLSEEDIKPRKYCFTVCSPDEVKSGMCDCCNYKSVVNIVPIEELLNQLLNAQNKMRAKFQCSSVKNYQGDFQEAELHAVYSSDEKDKEENNQFSEATPSGNLKITISNPRAINFFKPGKEYYLDFTEV